MLGNALAGIVLNVLFGETDPIFTFIGVGGAERWIVYPPVRWLIGFGWYVMGQSPLEAAERTEGVTTEVRPVTANDETMF